MSAHLRLISGDAPADRFDLFTDKPTLLGRGEGCDVRIDHTSLSRIHCSIELERDGWHVVDCKSTNGTRVGGYKVSDTVLAHGEELQIGALRFRFVAAAAPDASTIAAIPPPQFPLAGRHLGKFELLEIVHSGSGGTVFHAREEGKGREVALKVLAATQLKNEQMMQRFERGIHAAAEIKHPGIIKLFSTGKTDHRHFLAMEWVDGPSVRELLARHQRLPAADAVPIIRSVAEALEQAAAHGIVHRNIKPSTIIIAKSGGAKLGDFVLAKSFAGDEEEQVTHTGEVVGDAEYLAPECLLADTGLDGRADIYSLGVCLYEMLVGQPPFRSAKPSQVSSRVLNEPPLPPRDVNPEISAAVERIVLKCLAKAPSQRFQTPQELADALAALSEQDLAPSEESTERRATGQPPGADSTAGDEQQTGAADPQLDAIRPPGGADSDSDGDVVEVAAESVPESAQPSPPPGDADELDRDFPTSLGPPELPPTPPTMGGTTQFWKKVVIVPRQATEPAKRPITTLVVSMLVVVAVGAAVLFGPRIDVDKLKSLLGRKSEKAETDDADAVAITKSATAATKPSASGSGTKSGRKPAGTRSNTGSSTSRAAARPKPQSKQLKEALADPERLVVEPGSPLRNIQDALDAAKDGQVIEVASNESFRSEIKMPAKSITLVASPDFHPVIGNTLRLAGGGAIRIEGFHFEPYGFGKPAIEIEKPPEQLELAGCTMRSQEGVLIGVHPIAPGDEKPLITLDRMFIVGNVVLGLVDLPPDLRIENCCVVADQAMMEWQITAAAKDDAKFGLFLRKNTIAARNTINVLVEDESKAIAKLPLTTIRMDDNIIAFPSQYPGIFFRWDAWKLPDVPLDRFEFSGGVNAFCGRSAWVMGATHSQSDLAAAARPFLKTPEEWNERWATNVSGAVKVNPEFTYSGEPKDAAEVLASDFELKEESAQREMGADKTPLGADVGGLPNPPAKQFEG
jgi:serine/threonine protein kinase